MPKRYDQEQAERALAAARYYVSRRDKRRRIGPTINTVAKLHNCDLRLLQRFVGNIRSGKTPQIYDKATTTVEKRDHQAKSRQLPAWYYRVLRLRMGPDQEVQMWDFDEDISDLENTSDKETDSESRGIGCGCGGKNSGCGCQLQDADTDEDEEDERMSERSYDGSDADCYYELKEMREERKIEIRESRRRDEEEREATRKDESEMMKKVQDAYKSLMQAEKEGKIVPFTYLSSNTPYSCYDYHLFSSDYFDHLHDPAYYPTKYVAFYYIDEEGNFTHPQDKGAQLRGHVYLKSDTDCDFGPFKPPTQASSEEVRVACRRPSPREGASEITFQFISDNYLKLKISRDWVFTGKDSPPPTAPAVFEFAGIRKDIIFQSWHGAME